MPKSLYNYEFTVMYHRGLWTVLMTTGLIEETLYFAHTVFEQNKVHALINSHPLWKLIYSIFQGFLKLLITLSVHTKGICEDFLVPFS